MISFRILKSVLALSTLFGLLGCFPKSQDRPDETNGGNANFAVSAVSGTIGGSRNIGDFPLPGEKTYNFKACLIDFSRRTNIPNAKFLIKEIEQEIVTDAQGCLNWPESIKFNYLADSIWIKMTRTLVARGLQRGSRPIHFAINPWSHGENLAEVLDLSKQSTPYLLDNEREIALRLEGKDAGNNVKARNVWVENGELNVTNGKLIGRSYSWHDQIFLKPQILFTKTDATPVLVPILHGSFRVEISLISEDVKNQKIQRDVLAQQIINKVELANQTLMLDVDFILKKVPTSGQAILGVKLIPLGAPEGLHPFEGVFPLGNFQAFTQSTSLKISEVVARQNAKGQFSLNQFVGGKNANLNSTQVNSQGTGSFSNNHMESAGVFVEHFRIDDFKIVSETTLKKIWSYRIHACLTSTIANIGLTHQDFKVQISNEDGQVLESKTVTTEHDSCFYFEARTQEFDQNECHHYLKTSIQITNTDLLMNETESILINPWMEKAIDLRAAQDASQYSTTCQNKSDNLIFLKTMMLQRISYRPQVLDKSLQISQHGVYQITMGDSGIKDPSNEHTGLVALPKAFPDGKYLLRLAFVRSSDVRPDHGYVTHSDVVMTADGGTLQGIMDVDIKDLQSTMVRKMVIAQLFPIKMDLIKEVNWHARNFNFETLIDSDSKLISPAYFASTVVLGNPGAPIYLNRNLSDFPTLADIITKGFKAEQVSSSLIKDIVNAGETAQSALIGKNSFKENDPQAWADWAKKQNLELFWLQDKASLEKSKQSLRIVGDAKAELQELIDIDRLDAKWALQFCKILRNDVWKNLIDTKSLFYLTSRLSSHDSFMQTCQDLIKENPNAFIRKTNVYRVLHMMGPGVMNPANLAISNLSVSSGYGFTTGHTELDGTQSSLSISAGISGTIGKFFTAGFGGSYGSLHMETDDRNRHSTTDLGTSVSLGVTRWQFDLPVDRYQRCSLLRVNPNVFLYKSTTSRTGLLSFEYNKMLLRKYVDRAKLFKLSEEENPFTHGWMICSDQILTNPVNLPETYYMISQSNADSESFDSFDGINRRFFLPLRGTSDMARFKSVMCESRNYPDSGELTDETVSDLAAQISPLIRRMDSGPSLIIYDPNFKLPKTKGDESTWLPKKEEEIK